MRIERVLAPNPGPFTGRGTNTWLFDDGGEVLVIDPGPYHVGHGDRIVERIEAARPVAVLVTHTHEDHAPLANPLAARLEVPAIGHRPGPRFVPDLTVAEGSKLMVGAAQVEVIHTPGHSDDHLCFRVGEVLFTGDHMIGGSSVMVESMGPYLRSLEKLRGRGLRRLLPGHGEEMERPDEVIDWYLAHRRQRHGEVLAAVEAGASSIPDIVATVYADVDSSLHPLAARSVAAHLTLLAEEGRIALSAEAARPLPHHQ